MSPKRERMIAYFPHRRRVASAVLEEGFVAYDDAKDQFEKLKDVPVGPALFPTGYPSRVRDQGAEYVDFTAPYPALQSPGRLEELPRPRLARGLRPRRVPGTRYGDKDKARLEQATPAGSSCGRGRGIRRRWAPGSSRN